MSYKRKLLLLNLFRKKKGFYILGILCFLAGAYIVFSNNNNTYAKSNAKTDNCKEETADTFIVTAYCNCGKCCSWRYKWIFFGEPLYKSGPLKGKRKIIGRTASGTQAKKGTIAADTSVLPMGSIVEIPGYGKGRVEDTGGAIKGKHIDVWFPSHAEARKWGVKKLKVKILTKGKSKSSPSSSTK